MEGYKFSVLAYINLYGACKGNLFGDHLLRVANMLAKVLFTRRFTTLSNRAIQKISLISDKCKTKSIAKARATLLRLQNAPRAWFLAEIFITCQYIFRMAVKCDYFS